MEWSSGPTCRLHFVKGVSIRELQRRTGLHRTTIRRALRVYWLINVSLKSGAALSRADLVPPSPTVQNYSSIFENADFTAALRNSAIVTATTTLLALLVGSFAAYALARLRFPMKFLLLAVVLSISTFPPIAIAAPIFKAVDRHRALQHLSRPDHPLPDVRSTAVHLHPGVVLQGDPEGARGAALVDGATHFQAFRKGVLPLAAPGLVTAGLLTASSCGTSSSSR